MIFALILFTAFIVMAAVTCAGADHNDIAQGQYIDHAFGRVERASSTIVVSLVLMVCFHLGWGRTVAMCIYGAALFSALFCYRLNVLRGLPLDYVSLSNQYDTAFIMAFGMNAGKAAYVAEAVTCAVCLFLYL